LFQAEFAYNESTNRSAVCSPFNIIYGVNPRAPIDLAPIPDLKQVHAKAEDLIARIQEVHQMTTRNLQESTAKYKASSDKKRKAVEFDERDFMWAILTKDLFPVGV